MIQNFVQITADLLSETVTSAQAVQNVLLVDVDVSPSRVGVREEVALVEDDELALKHCRPSSD